jgi:hypothetical protein
MKELAALALMLALASGPTAGNPILGSWVISKGELAPWVINPATAQTMPGLNLIGLEITFEENRIVSANETLGCTDARYEQSDFPPEALFQGGLSETGDAAQAHERAKSLGLPEGNLKGVEVACSTGLFSYHFTDDDTLVFAFDNYIYTLTRK